MKLQQKIYNKFSIVLAMVMIFLALPLVAAAQRSTWYLKNSNSSGLPQDGTPVLCYSPTFTGGVYVAVADLNSDALAMNRIYVSRISLLTAAFDGGVGVVDSCDADAASKIRMLFDVRRNLRLTNDIVFDVPENNTPESFQALNYLRGAQASGRRIPVMELVVADSRNQQDFYKVIMEDVVISSYQSGAAESASTDTFSVNFAAIKFEYKTYDDKDKE